MAPRQKTDWNFVPAGRFGNGRENSSKDGNMHSLFYIIGLIVVVLAVINFVF